MAEKNLKMIMGLDDASKMPILGSIFWAGIIIPEHDNRKLKKIGVKDSKLLTSKKRKELFDFLTEAYIWDFVEIKPREIDN
ncbi:ribonuclease HII, partial [bacterium]|nr:ribonuclease HII [bacterium]